MLLQSPHKSIDSFFQKFIEKNDFSIKTEEKARRRGRGRERGGEGMEREGDGEGGGERVGEMERVKREIMDLHSLVRKEKKSEYYVET